MECGKALRKKKKKNRGWVGGREVYQISFVRGRGGVGVAKTKQTKIIYTDKDPNI